MISVILFGFLAAAVFCGIALLSLFVFYKLKNKPVNRKNIGWLAPVISAIAGIVMWIVSRPAYVPAYMPHIDALLSEIGYGRSMFHRYGFYFVTLYSYGDVESFFTAYMRHIAVAQFIITIIFALLIYYFAKRFRRNR